MLHNYIPLGSVSPDRIIATVPRFETNPRRIGWALQREGGGRSKSNLDGIHRVHATQHANRWARLSRRGNRQAGQMVTNILTNVFFFPHAHTCGAFFLFPLNGTTQQVVLFCFFLFAFVDVNGFEIGKYFPMAEKWPKKQRLTLHPSRRPTLEQWKMNLCWHTHTHTALGNLLSSDLGCFRATTHSPKKRKKKTASRWLLRRGKLSLYFQSATDGTTRTCVCICLCHESWFLPIASHSGSDHSKKKVVTKWLTKRWLLICYQACIGHIKLSEYHLWLSQLSTWRWYVFLFQSDFFMTLTVTICSTACNVTSMYFVL